MKVFVVFHTYDNGHQIEVFKDKDKSKQFFNGILAEYSAEYSEINEGISNNTDLIEASGGECNLELIETELQ